MEYRCFIHFKVPRVKCPKCGIHQMLPEWASEPYQSFTTIYERKIINLARSGLPMSQLERITGVNDTRLFGIVSRNVAKAYAAKDFSRITKICVDETSSRRGHKYVTVFTNAEGDHDVLFVTTGKNEKTFREFISEFVKHGGNPENITSVSMDMSRAFIAAQKKYLPNATVTFDKFHLIKLLNEAIDKVRREEVKTAAFLKGMRYHFLKNPDKLSAAQKRDLEGLTQYSKTAECYRLKLVFQDIFRICKDEYHAAIELDSWLVAARKSGIPQMSDVADTLQNHFEGIRRYFSTYLTNGVAEGLNTIIGFIKRTARGFANTRNFITMIYLRLSSLGFANYPIIA
jgi:transposase